MIPDCPPDEQLLAQATGERGSDAVRSHVEQCGDCQMRVKLLGGEIAELRSLSAPAAPSPAVTYVPGFAGLALPNATAVGRYVIVGALGSGGQADVYRVIDPGLGRDLVLKLSRRQSSDGDVHQDALLAEGRLLAQLDHPGLVRIFEIGIHEDRPFLVLEHVPGRNLEQVYKDKRPSAYDAARLVAEVARVVAYAHRRGVLHGDITPRNILIDDDGRARLIDFGLSKIESAWGDNPGVSGGTPGFVAPEIAPVGGRLGRAGPASDVFGLGATLYWLLTGQAPFAAPTAAEALGRARLCDIDFDALTRAQAPRRLIRICRQALATDPAPRPAPDMLADKLLRATRRWNNPRVLATIVVAVLLAGGGLWWTAKPDEDARLGSKSVVQSAPTIAVIRDDEEFILSNVLPLRTGERLAITCDVAPGAEAIVLWFDAAGKLNRLSPARVPAGAVDKLTYPEPHKWTSLKPPPGTELIVYCRGDSVSDEKVDACFPSGESLPRLPPQNYLTLRRNVVTVDGPRAQGEPERHAISKAREMMLQIDRNLGRHFDGVTAVAFPHRAADETEQ